MDDTSVVQLHRTLIEAIRRTRPGAMDRPVTVAEIYQDLVPYRAARAVGFEMNADYEYALLRLLAGEGDLARIEPREVRDKLRMELESANPDVGLFRHYAACDVWVNADDVPEVAEAEITLDLDEPISWEEEFVGPAQEGLEADAAAGEGVVAEAGDEEIADAFEAEEDDPQQVRPRFEIAAAAQPAAEPEPAEDETDLHACVFCGGELPGGRMINFCPFCGSDQSQRPCPSCGELLEPLWRFCISCGTRVRPLGDHVN